MHSFDTCKMLQLLAPGGLEEIDEKRNAVVGRDTVWQGDVCSHTTAVGNDGECEIGSHVCKAMTEGRSVEAQTTEGSSYGLLIPASVFL